jgi:hypothetical protein
VPKATLYNARNQSKDVVGRCEDLTAFGAISAVTDRCLLLFESPGCSPAPGTTYTIVVPPAGAGLVNLGQWGSRARSARILG